MKKRFIGKDRYPLPRFSSSPPRFRDREARRDVRHDQAFKGHGAFETPAFPAYTTFNVSLSRRSSRH